MSLRFNISRPIKRNEPVVGVLQDTDSRISVLDEYLSDVDVRLAALPAAVRCDITCELRQHLESSIAARIELGDDHEAATAAAIRQFGDASMIARRFKRAWTMTGRESVWPAARASAALFGSLGLTYAVLSTAALAHGASSALYAFFGVGLIAIPALAGVHVGSRFAGRAGLGTLYALAAMVLPALVFCDCANYFGMPGYGAHSGLFPHDLLGAWYLWQFTSILLTMCVVWPVIGSASAIASGIYSKRKREGAIMSN